MQLRKPSEIGAPRIAALATLPVFFKLEGKDVLVAGGSDEAAWKAELLAATGATVHVFATFPSKTMAAIITRDGLVHHPREWKESDFSGKAIAIGDVDNPDAFVAAAKNSGTPVNVIDAPKYCDFQFGSIVNRSPVVIGISSAGSAPILAQTIRQRIETLLPPAIAGWASAAAKMRGAIKRRWPDASVRRDMWRSFAQRAFTQPAPSAPKDAFANLDEATPSSGKVTLVGSGPGDAELLTLRAVRALQSADVVLFDDLVADDVLDLARREAKRMLVGKRGARPSCKQDDINALMLKLAGQGKHVVRLKSGDPMIFGRAGEEITILEGAGIPVDVVPGVTSALAAAAAAKVSLTHRDHAQSVRFVTGHSKQGRLPDLEWETLGDPNTTLMVYMGRRTAAQMATKLLEQGLNMSCPVAVFSNVGRGDSAQQVLTLGELAQEGLGDCNAPTLIGIGSVFGALNHNVQSTPQALPSVKVA